MNKLYYYLVLYLTIFLIPQTTNANYFNNDRSWLVHFKPVLIHPMYPGGSANFNSKFSPDLNSTGTPQDSLTVSCDGRCTTENDPNWQTSDFYNNSPITLMYSVQFFCTSYSSGTYNYLLRVPTKSLSNNYFSSASAQTSVNLTATLDFLKKDHDSYTTFQVQFPGDASSTLTCRNQNPTDYSINDLNSLNSFKFLNIQNILGDSNSYFFNNYTFNTPASINFSDLDFSQITANSQENYKQYATAVPYAGTSAQVWGLYNKSVTKIVAQYEIPMVLSYNTPKVIDLGSYKDGTALPINLAQDRRYKANYFFDSDCDDILDARTPQSITGVNVGVLLSGSTINTTNVKETLSPNKISQQLYCENYDIYYYGTDGNYHGTDKAEKWQKPN